MTAIPGLYQHFKGARYRVLFTALDVTDSRDTETVVYMALEDGVIYTREVRDFTRIVKWPDGKDRQRFIRKD